MATGRAGGMPPAVARLMALAAAGPGGYPTMGGFFAGRAMV